MSDDDRQTIDGLIQRADLDALVRLVDGWTAVANWAGLLLLRDRARAAVSTGRQLWPVATLAEYRLALHAPPQWAATVLDEHSGRFTIGPLTEVVAQQHAAADLATLLDDPTRFGFLAHERALRGEVTDLAVNPLDIPTQIQGWEPHYALATYSDDGVDAPSPHAPGGAGPFVAGEPGTPVDDPDVEMAVRQLFDGWTAASDGHADVVCVEGTAAHAVATLTSARAARLVPISAADAMAWLAWAGASGGANGRRRGAATGRFGAWWLLASLADLTHPWPPDADELGRAATDLRWWWWDTGEPDLGWRVQLAIEDPAEGYAWALAAHDAA